MLFIVFFINMSFYKMVASQWRIELCSKLITCVCSIAWRVVSVALAYLHNPLRVKEKNLFSVFFAASHASSELRAVWPTLLQHSILCRLKGKQTSLCICGSLRVKFSCVNLISHSVTQFYTCACIFSFIIFSRLCLTFDICLHGVRAQGRRSENFTQTFCKFTPTEIFSWQWLAGPQETNANSHWG